MNLKLKYFGELNNHNVRLRPSSIKLFIEKCVEPSSLNNLKIIEDLGLLFNNKQCEGNNLEEWKTLAQTLITHFQEKDIKGLIDSLVKSSSFYENRLLNALLYELLNNSSHLSKVCMLKGREQSEEYLEKITNYLIRKGKY